MAKIDVKRALKPLYDASTKGPSEVRVPSLRYLMIDGHGDPNVSPAYTQAVEALFSVSYAAKFGVRKLPGGCDYGVMPLEGLWWAEDMSTFVTRDKSRWSWTMMILQPEFVAEDTLRIAMADVERKKSLPALKRLRIEEWTEGKCAQVLHVGPFDEEGPTIERLHAFIQTRGELAGKHHEIYLSDIRRAAPAKWKTIIRQPMR